MRGALARRESRDLSGGRQDEDASCCWSFNNLWCRYDDGSYRNEPIQTNFCRVVMTRFSCGTTHIWFRYHPRVVRYDPSCLSKWTFVVRHDPRVVSLRHFLVPHGRGVVSIGYFSFR